MPVDGLTQHDALAEKSVRMAYVLWGHLEQMHPDCCKPNISEWAETFRNHPKTVQITLEDIKGILTWISDCSPIWKRRYIVPETFLRNYEKLKGLSEQPPKAKSIQTRIFPENVKKNIETLRAAKPSYVRQREDYVEHRHNGDRINLDVPCEEFFASLLKWEEDYIHWQYRDREEKIPLRFHKL